VPIGYQIDATRGVVRVAVYEEFSAEEAAAFLESLADDPALSPGMSQLVDLRQAAAPPTVAESERLALTFARFRDHFAGVRCAVIVAHPAMYGAIRQFSALAARAGVDVRPFQDAEAAAEWLRVTGRHEPNEAPLRP
jgi:hypothetical protein